MESIAAVSVGDVHSAEQIENLLTQGYTLVDHDYQPYDTARADPQRGGAGHWLIHDKVTGQWGLIASWFKPADPYASSFPPQTGEPLQPLLPKDVITTETSFDLSTILQWVTIATLGYQLLKWLEKRS